MCPSNLNRRAVDDTAGKHIRLIEQCRHVSDREKAEIRKMHETIAQKVERGVKD